MMREVLKAKIHRLTVTDSNLNYEGSITIDENLMEAADIIEYEKVSVANVTNGNRFETYAIKGIRGSGVICVNGAAAHLAKKDDIVIIFTYTHIQEDAIKNYKPSLVFVDLKNKIYKK